MISTTCGTNSHKLILYRFSLNVKLELNKNIYKNFGEVSGDQTHVS